MKVLLLDNVSKLGKVGEIVETKDGHARNYLIPMGLAVYATKSQIKFHQEKLDKAREKYEEELKELVKIAEEVDGEEFAIEKKATDDQKLFGSVTEKDIKKVLKEKIDVKKIESIDTKKIEKKIGKYSCKLDFGGEVEAKITINIKKKEK